MSVRFFLEFLKHPLATGAVAPSSRHLARTIVTHIGLEEAEVVVEYGPGTGAFTAEILARLKPGAVFFAVEKNAALAEAFRTRFPRVRLFVDSARHVQDFTAQVGVRWVDCIVCGLPWASFSDELQDTLLRPTWEVLRPGGRFATFAYLQGLLLSSGRSFRRKLVRLFSEVETSRVVWRNLPPAFVYRCVK